VNKVNKKDARKPDISFKITKYITHYFISGKMRTSNSISELHNGQLGSFAKLNDSRIHPWQSSLVQAHTFVSTSGTGSFGPRENDMNATPFSHIRYIIPLIQRQRKG